MKNGFFFITLLIVMTTSSCLKDKCTQTLTYTYFKPIYVTPEEYKIPVELSNPLPMREPGKIYFYKNYILINEVRKGLHVINNQDPTAPENIGFIRIPGNIDMAVMNNVLYADGYTDLLVININDIKNPALVERRENIFDSFYFAEGSNRILSHYEETEFNEKLDCSDVGYGSPFLTQEDGGVLFDNRDNVNTLGSNSNGSPQVGTGGSMARFTISKAHLFAVGEAEIFSIPIQSDGKTGNEHIVSLPWGIETISPYKEYLFLGANNGMHIMDISDPGNPQLRSSFTHARACDPVIVDNDIAYVTLRTGAFACPGDKNELQVLDVKDIFNPKLLSTHAMDSPHGLGFFGNQLYICEGPGGLKIFDKTDHALIGQKLLGHVRNVMAWDVIAIKQNLLLMIGEDGFYQYDCSDPKNVVLLSSIQTEK